MLLGILITLCIVDISSLKVWFRLECSISGECVLELMYVICSRTIVELYRRWYWCHLLDV
jgi:hypothetical protein